MQKKINNYNELKFFTVLKEHNKMEQKTKGSRDTFLER